MNDSDEMIAFGLECVVGALSDIAEEQSHIQIRAPRGYDCDTCEGKGWSHRCALCDYGSNYSPVRCR